MAQPKRRPSKARNTARRLVPIAIIAPGAALGTYSAVSFVSSPRHLYNAAQVAASVAQQRRAQAAENSYLQVVNAINRSAALLANLQSKSSSDEAGLGAIQSGISSIAATKPPTQAGGGSPAPYRPGTSSAGAAPSATPIAPIAQVPLSQPPAATTRASMLAAG